MSRSLAKVSKFGLVTYLLIVMLSVSSRNVARRRLDLPTICILWQSQDCA